MECASELQKFLVDNININQTRLDFAGTATSALKSYLENSAIKDQIESFTFQGSYSYRTIIKPQGKNGEYDVDISIKLKYNSEYNGNEKQYHQIIIDVLKGSDKYKDRVDLSKDRSIRIHFDKNEGEFYIDLVPLFIKDDDNYVIDRKTNTIEVSGGTEFRDRINSQNNDSNKQLKKVIRIFKYLKEHSWFNIKSVQLTLLSGRQVDEIQSSEFTSLSTSLYKITQSLKDELEITETLNNLDLSNPGLPEEIFDRNMDENLYQSFKEDFLELSKKIENAYIEENKESSIKLRQSIFGDNFGSGSTDSSKSNILSLYSHAEMPETARGRTRTTNVSKINISARYIEQNTFGAIWKPYNGEKTLPKIDLKFYAKLTRDFGGTDIKLWWQVTNEDNQYVGNKRGEIGNEALNLGYDSKYGYGIQESAQRKGIHRVKCYVIKDNKIIVGESNRFYVNFF